MGKLMALSLVTTLSAAVLFQPALLARSASGRPTGRGRRRDRAEQMEPRQKMTVFAPIVC